MSIFSFFNFLKLRNNPSTNIFLLNDHKTGFKLSNKIAGIIRRNSNLNVEVRTFYLFWNNYKQDNNKYIVIVRHPKEIIISGYLYHKVCSEEWSRKVEGYYYNSWEQNHFYQGAVAKNKTYLDKAKTFSSPISYQEKLNILPQTEGIIHEMNSVAKLTIDGMYQLNHYHHSNTIVIKYEDLVFNHDKTIIKMCDFLEFSSRKSKKIIEYSLVHNLLIQKKKNQVTSHATNKNVIKDRYKEYWNETIEAEFNKLFPADILSKFDYE